jgi:hypothetical protein
MTVSSKLYSYLIKYQKGEVMKALYIDESGNTGPTSSLAAKFNFEDQRFYALAGLLIDQNSEKSLEEKVHYLKDKHNIKLPELKAKSLYLKKPKFIEEVIDTCLQHDVVFFIELMDKLYYLDMQLVEFCLTSTDSKNEEASAFKEALASNLRHENHSNKIYHQFIESCNLYSNQALEELYEFLISYFDEVGDYLKKGYVQMVRFAYHQLKANEGKLVALETYLPKPDLNSKEKWIHLLPNYHAFSNLIGRANLYSSKSGSKTFKIIHDNQPQFESIYKDIITMTKKGGIDDIISQTSITSKAKYDLDELTEITFIDSKKSIFIQLADLVSGIIMRSWSDIVDKRNLDFSCNHLSSILKVQENGMSGISGINYVVSYNDFALINGLLQYFRNK